MTMTAQPVGDAVVPPRGSEASLAHLTRSMAGVIIALSATGRLALNLTGYYLMDDFAFIARAGRPDALDLSVITAPHLGHVMPAGHVVNWVLQTLAPWNYYVPALLMAGGWLLCLLLMYRLLIRWLGSTPAVLVPLAIYAATPLSVQVTTWWAAAVNAIPLQLCALLGAQLLLPRRPPEAHLTWSRQIGLLACVIVSMGFFTKGVLLPILFFGLAFAWAPGSGRRSLWHAWRSAPLLWISLAAITVIYGLGYRAALGDDLSRLGSASPIELLGRVAQSIVGALLPSWAGGPVAFTDGADPWSVPPPWVVGLGFAAFVGCCVLVVRGSPVTRRLALLTVIYALGCIVLLTFGRQTFMEVSSGALRYFADWAVPATLLIASIASDHLGDQPSRDRGARWLIAGLGVMAFTAMSISTTLQLADNPQARAVRTVTATALASLQEQTSGPILDQWAPPIMINPLYGDYALSTWVFADAPGAHGFADQGTVLRLWGEGGVLQPARVEGPIAQRERPCPADGATTQTLTLTGVVVPFSHVVELSATSRVATVIGVSIGGGPVQEWSLPGGEVTAYRVQVAGPGPQITITIDPQAGACVSSVTVGNAVPVEGST